MTKQNDAEEIIEKYEIDDWLIGDAHENFRADINKLLIEARDRGYQLGCVETLDEIDEVLGTSMSERTKERLKKLQANIKEDK